MTRSIATQDVSSWNEAPPINATLQEGSAACDSSNHVESASLQEVLEICCDAPDILFKALKVGRLRGIVHIIGCDNPMLQTLPVHLHIAQELIRRDILVLISDCAIMDTDRDELAVLTNLSSAGHGLAEMCDYLDIPPVAHTEKNVDQEQLHSLYEAVSDIATTKQGDLPMAVIAPKWNMEDVLEAGLAPGNGDTVFPLEGDPMQTAELIDAYLHGQRLNLNWCDRYHCSIHS